MDWYAITTHMYTVTSIQPTHWLFCPDLQLQGAREWTKDVRLADGTGRETLVHGHLLRLQFPLLTSAPLFDCVILVTWGLIKHEDS